MKRTYCTSGPSETKKIAQIILKDLKSERPKKGAYVLALEGDLGGGKTTFLQGLAKALGIKDKILSPTFVIMRKFSIPENKKIIFNNFYHLDCYRIRDEQDILALGFSGIVSCRDNIVAVEWSEKIKKILPPGTTIIKFGFISGEKRKIEIIK
jgi:tRNA threonylcarbamoyladenosine biosynthesis protein TsaE